MEDKLERSLSKILDSTYTLSDDSILAQLEKHLEDQVESDDFSHWKDTILLPWCLRVIPQWESLKRNIKLFVIQVVKILTNNSRDLSKILASDLLNRIRDKVCPMMVKEISQYDLPLIVNYIQLMNNVIRHSDGVNWFMDSGTTIFFDLLISKHSLMRSQNLIDTVERLLSDTIAVLHESDIEKCFQLIDQIMKPLGLERSEPRTPQMDQLFEKAETYLSTKKETLIKFTSLQSALKNVPFINLLNCLLETKQPHLGICKALAEYNFEEWLWIKAFSIDITPDHIGSYIKLIIYIKFSEFDNSIEKLDEILLTVSFLHRLAFLRKRPDLVYDIMLLCMQLSSLRASPEPTTDYSLDSNLFSIFIIPLQPFSGFPFCSRSVIWEFPDIFSNLLIDDKVEVIRSTFKVISRMKGSNLLDKKKMNIIFGTFISILGTYQKMFQKKDPQNELQKADIVCPVKYLSSILSFYPKFLAEIVSLLEDLVKSQVKDDWCSCSQTDTGMISLRTIIDFEEVDTYAKGKILSLLTTILNVLKPNDNPSINDAFVKKRLYPLKHLLLKYICHPEWGIRDSVIELIKSMTIQSQQGFPRIIDLLLDSNIALAIFNVAFVFNENEDYIKISALRCLQMMVQSKQIWEELFALNILDTLLYLLSSEDSKNASNSLVRAELISLIARIYEAGGISESQIDSVYKQMVYYAIDDLYWEVKVNALSFWKAVMKSVYEENCLVDGQFPDDSNPAGNAKSKLMLEKILSRLNSIGCLQVLWETLNDACDFTVARVSASILSNLVDILKRYNHLEIPNQDQSSEIEVDVAHNDSCNQDQITVRDPEPGSETIIVDNAINFIVSSRDSDLLASLTAVAVNSDDNQQRETAKHRNKNRIKIFTVDEFLTKLSAKNIYWMDEWVESSDEFIAVMDTILGFDSNRDESINAIDCY